MLYRFLAVPVALAFAGRAVWLRLSGRETGADLRERLIGPRVFGPAVWVHAASVGELNAARPVIAALAERGRKLLVTATTTTGRDTVRGWALPGVTAGLAPLDLPGVTRRMLRAGDIGALVIIENEVWPMRIVACHRMRLPVAMLNARMSARSARVWERLPRLARRVFGPMALVAPQDDGTAERLAALGVRADALVLPPVNLKALYLPATTVPHPGFNDVARSDVVLAAATHEGEDAAVLSAFGAARAVRPGLRLIVAPRHPARGTAVAELARAAGFAVTRRGAGEAPGADVYVADTLGEMDGWYAAAGTVFVGGSLVDKGGHTPFEPLAHGCAVLHGPHVRNFAAPYAALDAAGGAVSVADAAALGAALADAGALAEVARRARSVFPPVDIAPLLARLRGLLR